MIIDGINLNSLGAVYPQDRQLPLTGSSHNVAQVLDLPGGVRNGGSIGAGTLSVELLVRGATAHAARLVLDEIMKRCRVGAEDPVRLAFDDIPDREWLGHFDQNVRQNGLGTWTRKGLKASLVFSLPDPRARAQAETVATPASGENVALDLSNAKTEARVEIASVDSGQQVEVLVLDNQGATLHRLAWTNTTGAAGTLVIDAKGRVLTLGGTWAGDDRLDPTSTFPVLDPNDKAATLQVTGGTGITVRYRKRWYS